MIEIIILQKYGDIESHSNPENLFKEASEKKIEFINNGEFKEDLDEFIIIFDRDSYKPVDKKRDQYLQYIDKSKESVMLGITNPCFELWLLLHCDNILDDISDHYEEYRQNQKISNTHTFTSKRFSDVFGRNSKSNLKFEELVDKVDIAIKQEKSTYIKNDIYEMCDKIGSNIGEVIEKLRIDPRFS